MKSILICHPGRSGSHWLLYMLKRITGLSTLPAEPEEVPVEGIIWGSQQRYPDIEERKRLVDVIFLLRDPRDVEVSTRLYDGGKFADRADGIVYRMTWYKWALAHMSGAHVVRYELLWDTPEESLRFLLENMDRECDMGAVRAAVAAECFEQRSGGRHRGEEDPAHHVRKGIVGDYLNHWSERKLAGFMRRWAREMQLLGYV